jgi:hypothetical protein
MTHSKRTNGKTANKMAVEVARGGGRGQQYGLCFQLRPWTTIDWTRQAILVHDWDASSWVLPYIAQTVKGRSNMFRSLVELHSYCSSRCTE